MKFGKYLFYSSGVHLVYNHPNFPLFLIKTADKFNGLQSMQVKLRHLQIGISKKHRISFHRGVRNSSRFWSDGYDSTL